MSDNLLAMQRSAKAIRNPFGFDFKYKWNGETAVFPGDNQFYSYVGPLARHIVKHLKMAVLYRYHDEQVAKFKAAGKIEEARKYRNSEALANKVHKMITGEDDPALSGKAEDVEQAQLDLDLLKKEMGKVDSQAANSTVAHDISSVLDQATEEAMSVGKDLGQGESASVSGQAPIGEVAPEAPSLPTEPIPAAQPVPVQDGSSTPEPTQPAPANPVEEVEAFPGLQEL